MLFKSENNSTLNYASQNILRKIEINSNFNFDFNYFKLLGEFSKKLPSKFKSYAYCYENKMKKKRIFSKSKSTDFLNLSDDNINNNFNEKSLLNMTKKKSLKVLNTFSKEINQHFKEANIIPNDESYKPMFSNRILTISNLFGTYSINPKKREKF